MRIFCFKLVPVRCSIHVIVMTRKHRHYSIHIQYTKYYTHEHTKMRLKNIITLLYSCHRLLLLVDGLLDAGISYIEGMCNITRRQRYGQQVYYIGIYYYCVADVCKPYVTVWCICVSKRKRRRFYNIRHVPKIRPLWTNYHIKVGRNTQHSNNKNDDVLILY